MFTRTKTTLTALAAIAASFTLATPANAVFFPAEAYPFRIQVADDTSLCLTVEPRTKANQTNQVLVTRPCDDNLDRQKFTYQAGAGFIHNAAFSKDKCLTGIPVGVGNVFVMTECGEKPHHPAIPRKFKQTKDAHLFVTSTPKPDSKHKPVTGCLEAGPEGSEASRRDCSERSALNLVIEPA